MVTVISNKGLSKYPKARLLTAKSDQLNDFASKFEEAPISEFAILLDEYLPRRDIPFIKKIPVTNFVAELRDNFVKEIEQNNVYQNEYSDGFFSYEQGCIVVTNKAFEFLLRAKLVDTANMVSRKKFYFKDHNTKIVTLINNGYSANVLQKVTTPGTIRIFEFHGKITDMLRESYTLFSYPIEGSKEDMAIEEVTHFVEDLNGLLEDF